MIFKFDVSKRKRRIRVVLARFYLELRHWPKSNYAFGHIIERCKTATTPCGHRFDLGKFSIYWGKEHV